MSAPITPFSPEYQTQLKLGRELKILRSVDGKRHTDPHQRLASGQSGEAKNFHLFKARI